MNLNIIRRIFLLLFVMVFAGCNNDAPVKTPGGDEPLDEPIVEPTNRIVATLASQSRTSLGPKIGDIYPVYWSEGDQIAVNGTPSEAIEISEDRKRATFTVSPAPEFPRHIAYPYHEATTAERTVVEFPAEQQYTEGSFSEGSAPMCGYAESGSSVELCHLATILRFPIKAKSEGVVLKRVVVTADNAIAGVFEVDCKSAEIVATESDAKSVTYTLPSDFVLSTTAEKVLHISLPAVNVSSCSIEFMDSDGGKMVATLTLNKPLTKGVVREFKTITYDNMEIVALEQMGVEEDELYVFHKKVYGNIRYDDGSPIEGVAVSDGFQVVTTDENGYYELNDVTKESWYIYCSLPADVEVPLDELGRPVFFKKYPAVSACYNFTFKRLKGGAEREFSIFALSDTQPTGQGHLDHFRTQVAPEIKTYSKSLGMPCYGMVLGDLVGSVPDLMDDMRSELAYNKMGMPIFTVMGNHDHVSYSANSPLFPDARNSHWMLKIQRDYEECFGPVNYSFNRGDVHIIGMRNVRHKDNISAGNYETGFTTQQFEWLKADLALVPKDKMVVICLHIPIMNGGKEGDGTYRQEMLNLLDEYAESHILSGHTHYMYPYDYVWNKTGHKMYEHCIAATRYDMPNCNIHRDGSPCGYAVLKVKDNAFVDWFYKGCAKGMNSRDDQIRLYRGATIIGAEPSDINSYGTKGYYQLPFDNGTLLANIFSSDPSWKIEVYEDSKKTGEMTHFYAVSGSTYDDLVGDGSYENPRRVGEGVNSSRDFWAIGILFGYLGSKVNNNYNGCHTMWRYKLTNPDAKHIEVRATDRFGYVYTEDTISDNTNLNGVFWE